MWWLVSLIVIVLWTFSPVIALYVMQWTGQETGKGGSDAALPFLMIITLPTGGIAVLLWVSFFIIKAVQ